MKKYVNDSNSRNNVQQCNYFSAKSVLQLYA